MNEPIRELDGKNLSKKESILPALVALLFLASIFGVTFDSISAASNPFSTARMSASTYVSGRITTNTTWTLAESPYVIEGDVVVETDVFLTIEPGVVVKFTNGTNLIIDGALIADGNFTHPIAFTSNATTPQPGDWGTIRFRDTSIDEACIIDWAIIEYASDGITIYRSSPKISNSTMQHNVDGFYSESEGIARISNSSILNNTYGIRGSFAYYYYYPPYTRSQISNSRISNNRYGVDLGSGYLMIQESTISNNTDGIRSSGTLRILGSDISYNTHGIVARSATISKSVISKNNGVGVSPGWYRYDNTTYYYEGTFTITYSTITGNKENGIVSKGSSTIHFSNLYNNIPYDAYNAAPFSWGYGDVNATDNWWGTTNTTEIDEHIYDYYDDYNLKRVYYQPFLESEVTIPPIAHDVAITNVTASPTSVSAGGSVYVTVDIVNEGDFDENVTVIARYDSVEIGNWTSMYGLLQAGASTTASFYWYTWDVPSGNYTINAEANVVPEETDTADNVYVDGIVEVIGPPPEPPYVSFTYSPYYPSVGEPVTFDASYSYDMDGYIVSYVWNFGDGNVTIETTPIITHVYTVAGTYTVNLTVTDNDGVNATSTQSVTISPPGVHDVAIIDVFVYSTEVPPGEVVLIEVTVANEGNFSETFDVTVYHDSTIIGTRTFNLGSGATTIHVFSWETVEVAEGTYLIKAEATVVEGETDTADNTYVDGTVTILPELVVHDIAIVIISAGPMDVHVGDIVFIEMEVINEGDQSETFDVYVYADTNTTVIGDEIIIAVFSNLFLDPWDTTLLDALWDTTSVEPDHYTISAEVPPVPDEVDTADNTIVDGTVTVVLPPPIASFSWEPETLYVGDSVVFDASASYDPDGTIVGYYWEFGDGTTANTTEPIIEHTYDQANTFAVALTVTDNDGLTNTVTAHITVIHRVLSVELSGEFDYLEREHVRIKIAALVRDAVTMEPVSDANVSIQVYDDKNKLWVSSFMKETPSGTGIYIWTSRGTILSERIKKGVYLVRIGASSRDGPTAYNMMLFHIDPPAEGANQTLYYYAILVIAIALTSVAGITIIKRRIVHKIRRLNR